jgi:protein CpxP
MKKIFLMLAFGALAAGTATAQEAVKSDKKARFENREDRQGNREKRNPEAMAARQLEMFDKQLDLSKKQEKQVQALSLKRTQEYQALRSRTAAPKDQRPHRETGHQEMKAINDRWEAGMKDILSKKQYAQYEANRQEMKTRRFAEKSEHGKKGDRKKGYKRPQRDNS